MRLQEELVGAELGEYLLLKNSCFTHVNDVLAAGGLDIPTSGKDGLKWIKALLSVNDAAL